MELIVRELGKVDYQQCWQAMHDFTLARHGQTLDECWIVQHDPVYTLGQAAKKEHILNAHDIPVIQTDRGGQVTYHAPGQWVFYLLVDLKRHDLGVRQFVSKMENAVIAMLEEYEIKANADPKAPGVYVDGAKIAALGMRIKRRCSYHGLSVNVNMDLTPFNWINPCGYKGLKVINTRQLNSKLDLNRVKVAMLKQLIKQFSVSRIKPQRQLPETWPEEVIESV